MSDTTDMEKVINHLRDRERRETNIIDYNVEAESNPKERKLRAEVDREKIDSQLETIGKTAKPEEYKRLGNFIQGKYIPP